MREQSDSAQYILAGEVIADIESKGLTLPSETRAHLLGMQALESREMAAGCTREVAIVRVRCHFNPWLSEYKTEDRLMAGCDDNNETTPAAGV